MAAGISTGTTATNVCAVIAENPDVIVIALGIAEQ